MFGFDLTSKVEEITPLQSIQVGTQQLGEYSTMIVRSVVRAGARRRAQTA